MASAVSIFTLEQIKRGLPPPSSLLGAIADSLVLYSQRKVLLAPASHLSFAPAGVNADCCVKFAFAIGGRYWVGKVASGFYDNPSVGLPSSSGLMLVFDLQVCLTCKPLLDEAHLFTHHLLTLLNNSPSSNVLPAPLQVGLPRAVLLDEGHLTDLRTALAATVSARALGPRNARAVGILGAGTIATLLPTTLRLATACPSLVVWARREEQAKQLAQKAEGEGWSATTVPTPGEVMAKCDIIFCCTPARAALLYKEDLRTRPPGHGLFICALGADAKGKQELHPSLVASAQLLVPDSKAQCFEFGELSHALGESLISETDPRVIELGEILSTHVGLQRGGEDDTRFTLVDSTGIGASDLAIAEAVYSQLGEGSAPPTAPQHRWRHPLTVGQSRL
ncbi:MAG: hypothetical protein SGPRY_003840 [Prymnesium sp.]